ncbi:FkbM family methyltransferase [Hyphomicrobium sp. MC8b]|uniref:FkbM family methyltransferase n=1 Tax=Hyphomicrobium sp. MC8b TaxID=300273 RepID=UPI00391DF91C
MRASAIRSALRAVVPFPVWQTAGFVTRIPSYWRVDRSEALRVRHGVPGLPLYVTKDIHVFAPETITAYRCWQYHGVEINDSTDEVADFLELSRGRRSLIDIGAQTGFISALFARSTSAPSHILSIEPDLRVFSMLERAVVLNKAEGTEWTIKAAAISDHSGVMSMPSFNRIYENGDDRDHGHSPNFDVPVMTLRDALAELNWTPDLMKIDVESFEYEILCSSLDLITRIRPALQLEVHWQMLAARHRNARDFLGPLADVGYRGIRRCCSDIDKWMRAGRSEPVSRLALQPA